MPFSGLSFIFFYHILNWLLNCGLNWGLAADLVPTGHTGYTVHEEWTHSSLQIEEGWSNCAIQKALPKFLSEDNCMVNESHWIYTRFESANCLTSKNHDLVISSAGWVRRVLLAVLLNKRTDQLRKYNFGISHLLCQPNGIKIKWGIKYHFYGAKLEGLYFPNASPESEGKSN